MPDISTLFLFSLAAGALTLSPGPDMVLIASRSAAQGRTAGFATWAGIAAGTYFHALAAALGLSQLFLAVPIAYDLVRYIGAAYLLYLAWQAFSSSSAQADIPTEPKTLSVAGMFRQGLVSNLLNPKMAIFVLALFPQFLDPAAGSVALQIMVFATVLNTIGLFVNGIVVLLADRFAQIVSENSKVTKLLNYGLGIVFAGLAARLLVDSRQ